MTNGNDAFYLLLLNVSGVSDEEVINQRAKTVHGAYMEEFGAAGAMTVMFVKVDAGVGQGLAPFEWQYVLGYKGPPSSAAWLENRIQQEAAQIQATVTLRTYNASDRGSLM